MFAQIIFSRKVNVQQKIGTTKREREEDTALHSLQITTQEEKMNKSKFFSHFM